MNTLPETNIFAPENKASQGRAVSFREGTSRIFYKSEQIIETSLVGQNPNGWV